MLKHLDDSLAGLSGSDVAAAWSKLRASLPPTSEAAGHREEDRGRLERGGKDYSRFLILRSSRIRELERRIGRLEQRFGLAGPSIPADTKD